MTLNDIAYWYGLGLMIQVIYITIQTFRKKGGDDKVRLQRMWDFAAKEDIPMSVLYGILLIYCLMWPFSLMRMVLRVIGIDNKKGS